METNASHSAENRLADINEQASTSDVKTNAPAAAKSTTTSVSTSSVSNVNRVPNRVVLMHTGNSAIKLGLNSTPRIDISRASSSSQQEDSRDSSPENVFEQVPISFIIIIIYFATVCDVLGRRIGT